MAQLQKKSLLFLVLCFLFVWDSYQIEEAAQPPRSSINFFYITRRGGLRFVPEHVECFAPLDSVGCRGPLYESAWENKMQLNQGCCDVLLNLNPECLDKVFSTAPFQREFGSMLKEYCASPPQPKSDG